MPIFAKKREEIPEAPEEIPEVPTAEELKKITSELVERLGREKPGKLVEELKRVARALEEKPAEAEVKIPEEKPEELPRPEVKEELPPEEAVPTPPLFIKLERYHRLLRHLNELKRILTTTRLTVSTLAEIDKMMEENVRLLQKAIERFDKKLADVDAELLRPRALPERLEKAEIGAVEGAIGDLRAQLESLKEELEGVA